MRETILGQLGARLAREDLSGTADWVSRMEHDKGSQRITDNLLMQWVPQDAAGAAIGLRAWRIRRSVPMR